MLTITRSRKKPNGYTVRVSEPGLGVRAYSVEAASIDALVLAVQHYFGHGTCAHMGERPDNCPFCRLSTT